MQPRQRRAVEVPPIDPATEDQQKIIFGMFVAINISLTVFQKIGYVVNSSFAVPLAVPITYAALTVGFLLGKPVFRPERLILYLVIIALSAASTIFLAPTLSAPSLIFYALVYLPFVAAFNTTKETYDRCLRFFSATMLVFAVVVWIQHALQIMVGPDAWPNLDKLLPSNFLIPEFNYLQPIEWSSRLMKPSGICFLEVSILSQFITLALIIELIFLQRTWRAAFFGATLFATFAGTGLFLLAVSLPIIFTRFTLRTFLIVIATVFVAAFVALELHWLDMVAHRFGEFQQAGSSGNSRFIAPLDRVREALMEPRAVFSGVGAGQIQRGGNAFWWPFVKATVEYGLIEGLLLYVFFFHSMLDRTPSRELALVLAIWFSFEGTLLTTLYPLGCVMLSSMFVFSDDQRLRRRSARSGNRGARVAALPGTG